MELKQRSDMDKKYLWDLSHIFKSKTDWEAAFKEAEAAVKSISVVPGTLSKSKESFKAGFDAVIDAMKKVELVYLYAMLQKAGDNGDDEYQDMEGRATSLYVTFGAETAFIDPEILSIPPEKLAEFVDYAPVYRHAVDSISRAREHTLDAEREKMLALLGDAAQTPNNCFDMLESVDITFPNVHDEKGEEKPLTHATFSLFRESEKQEVRREAFEVYFGEFKRYINTFAAMYSGNVKFDSFFADVRGFGSACEAALFGSAVPVSVYDSLIEAVHSALPSMRRYLELRKKALGLTELNLYDLYCPMVESVDLKISYEDACKLVKNALAPLGETYAKLLDRAFSEHWIDVYENKGKTTGAFSCGVYGVHPYVLLNFTGTLDDAFTIAHELGHAMHSYFSAEANDYVNSDYKILVAEVASTVNEVLLTKYLLSTEKDKCRRAYILNHFLEGFRTTVFRQTLFAEFERKAHEMYKSGVTLTPQALSKVYHELNSLYYEGAVNNEVMDIEWARIPHFYNAFYVYQYATGFSSAVAIADSILNSGGAENYLKFLTTGGSDYPLNELKITGVDLTKPDTVERAMKVFSETLDEMEKAL
jgi:oligoendopeptidase F